MIASSWMALAVSTVFKGTVLLLVTLTLARALRRSSAATRHLAWTAGVVGVLAMPLVAALLPWRIPVIPRVAMPAVTMVGEPRETQSREALAVESGREPAVTADPAIPVPPIPVPPIEVSSIEVSSAAPGRGLPDARTVLALLPVLWALGALAILGRLAFGVVALARSARRARPATGRVWERAIERASGRLELDRPVTVLLSEDVAMPLVTGIFRPRVILPADADAWSDERRRAVLSHELAHVRRGDLVPHFVAWLACALWWFHPLVWIAARHLRTESERACDDLVLGLGTRASEYAHHLLQIVSGVRVSRRVPAAVLPLARPSEFEGRVLAILEPGTRRGGISRLGGGGALAAIAILAIPLSAVVPVPPPLTEAAMIRSGLAANEDRAGAPRATDAKVDKSVGAVSNVGIGEGVDVDPDFDFDGLVVIRTSTAISTATSTSTATGIASQSAKGDTGKASSTLISALVRILSDAEPATRAGAANALGQLEDPRAVAALSRALREDTDAGVRKAAAWALGEIEDPAGVPALSDALRQDRDMDVRRMAVWALGEIEDPSAVPALSVALRDQDVDMRRKAAWALGEIEDASAVPALSTALREDRDVEVRNTAVWALGEIEDPSAIPALTVALRDQDVEMRRKAAWALGEIESPQAVEALSAAARDTDREVRKTAVWALGEIEDPAGVPALAAALRDSDSEIRKTAAWALAEIDTPAAYEALVPLLESDDPELRRLAVEAIAHQ